VSGQIIEKDWGYEEVCVNEPTHCGKKLYVKLGRQCSLHHHTTKDETFHVLEGPALMQVGEKVFWAAKYTNVRIPPGTKHRFGAVDQSVTLVEFSSHHTDDDVVRHEPSGPLSMWKSPSLNKTVSVASAARAAMDTQVAGKRVAFTNGCFDLLHSGHVHLLEAARSHADLLIVGLNSDKSIRQLKGTGRPVQPEKSRARLLAALIVVDLVVLFDEDDPLKLIKTIHPNVLVKGADYDVEEIVGADYVISMGGTVVRVTLVEGSTSDMISNIKSADYTTRRKNDAD